MASYRKKALNDKIIKEFISQISDKVRTHIKRIVLFGSRAKNNYKIYSDYDLLIILDKKSSSVINKIYDVVVDFLVNYGVDISLKIYSEEDYNYKLSLGTPFMKEIKKYGEVLWTPK
jgi:predicted nucleotidyltransferase